MALCRGFFRKSTFTGVVSCTLPRKPVRPRPVPGQAADKPLCIRPARASPPPAGRRRSPAAGLSLPARPSAPRSPLAARRDRDRSKRPRQAANSPSVATGKVFRTWARINPRGLSKRTCRGRSWERGRLQRSITGRGVSWRIDSGPGRGIQWRRRSPCSAGTGEGKSTCPAVAKPV